jgi:hypothetical protein
VGLLSEMPPEGKVRIGRAIRVGDELTPLFRHAHPIPPTRHCGPDQGLHVRRESLGVVPRSRAIIDSPNPNSPDSQRLLAPSAPLDLTEV